MVLLCCIICSKFNSFFRLCRHLTEDITGNPSSDKLLFYLHQVTMATIHFGHIEQNFCHQIYIHVTRTIWRHFSVIKFSILNLTQLIALSCLCTVLMMHIGEHPYKFLLYG